MNRIYLFFVSLVFLVPNVVAQKNYSYVSDRKFNDPTDLLGYNFCPNQKEIPKQTPIDLAAGAYSFGITRSNVYVKGEGIEGVYNVNNISPTDYGYKILLMNARDPTSTGHLKIILNKLKQADVLVFLPNTKTKEVIYYLPEMPADKMKQEKAYFTDRSELAITEIDSLWGKKIYPFLKTYHENGVQDRIQPADSVSVAFLEQITTIDKSKKKNTPSKEEEQEIREENTNPTNKETETEKKVKIIKEHFIILKTNMTDKDGKKVLKTIKFSLKKTNKRENKRTENHDDRYEFILTTDKGEEISLYLDSEHAVSYISIDNTTYFVRGY